MKSKLLGGILLIIGTSIGAGMLGLPIAAAQLGFPGAMILLVLCWLIMIVCGFLVLEINFWLPQNSNLISMAQATMGPIGQLIAWITYLLLLYSLLCAYIAGGSDLFHNILLNFNINLPMWLTAILFTLIFGTIVYLGIHSVDRANRVLIGLKFGAFIVLVALLTPFVSSDKLSNGNLHHLTSTGAITITIVSFCWSTLIPSLRVYLSGDVNKLKKAIYIGSSFPLICYIIWDMVTMGVIPLSGENSFHSIIHSQGGATSNFVDTVSTIIGRTSVTFFTKFFTSICVLTSFLGVALCLTDFFSDGLRLEKKGKGNFIIYGLTFIPSVCIAIFIPNVFIKALEYAGIYCTILLILLPALMAWRGRYHLNMPKDHRTWGGKPVLALLIIGCFVLIIRTLFNW